MPVVIVFERPGGLTKRDLRAIGRIGDGLDRLALTGATPILDPFSGAPRYRRDLAAVAGVANGIGPISRDGEAALLFLAIDAGGPRRRGRAASSGSARYLRAHTPAGAARLRHRPGRDRRRPRGESPPKPPTPCSSQPLGLVLLLLLLVYRAPVLALLPLLAVGAAYLVAVGIAYLLIEAGWITVNAEGTMLLLVLIFGAGTDYSLLLVHRYREELATGPGGLAGPSQVR